MVMTDTPVTRLVCTLCEGPMQVKVYTCYPTA